MTENKNFDAERVKLLWERLQKDQKDAPYNRGASISSVKIVNDGNGGKTVQIRMSNGHKINDSGNQMDLFRAMTPKKRINLGRLMSLIEAVRTLGFEAVAMGLPPELKRALLQACKKCGIPLKVERKNQQTELIFLSKKTEPVKSVKAISKPKAVVSPTKKILASFSSMTSPRMLDLAVRFQQKRNKEYLAARMARCENDAKEDFLMLCCQTAFDFHRKDEKKLTDEEKKIKAFIKRYALKNNNANEFHFENRDKILKKMSLKDLPETLRQKCLESQKRYKYLCDARNKALELAQIELKKKYYQNKLPINISLVNLVRISASRLPPPEKRNVGTLARTVSDMNGNLKEFKKELKETLRERRKNVGKMLSGLIKSKTEKERTPVSQTMQRHNFIENTLIRKMMEKSASVY